MKPVPGPAVPEEVPCGTGRDGIGSARQPASLLHRHWGLARVSVAQDIAFDHFCGRCGDVTGWSQIAIEIDILRRLRGCGRSQAELSAARAAFPAAS